MMDNVGVFFWLALCFSAGNAGVLRILGPDELGELAVILTEDMSENTNEGSLSPPSVSVTTDRTAVGLLDSRNEINALTVSADMPRLFENIEKIGPSLEKIQEVMEWNRATNIRKEKENLQTERNFKIFFIVLSILFAVAFVYSSFSYVSKRNSEFLAQSAKAMQEKNVLCS